MISRTLATCLLWFAGASCAVALAGQTYTNSLMFMACCFIVAGIWASLLWKRPRPRVAVRVAAWLIVVANLALLAWASYQLPEAWDLEDRFNRRPVHTKDAGREGESS